VTSPYQDNGGYGRPSGDGWYGPPREDVQAWDPAYPHPPAMPYGYGYGYPSQPPAQAVRHSRGLIGAVVVLAAALVASLIVIATGVTRTTNGVAVAGGSSNTGSSNTGGSSGNSGHSGGSNTTPGNGSFPFPSGGSSGSSGSSSGKATKAQQVGVVDIYTVQKYNSAAAAGTGIVLSSDGEILTNNHVIEGSTSIRVRIISTGKTYVAKVVGTAPSKDVAVIKLVNASGLTVANLGDSDTVAVADKVVGVGNAGGTGGTPSSASGKVTALHKSITASDESGTNSERLHDIIVTDAPIKSGDSGGPLFAATGRVIGMDTAASTTGQQVGFAIPINDALAVVAQIRTGIETSAIHIGYPGFLGVSVSPSSGSGALVASVLSGGPAARAGITGGDVITKVNSTAVASSTQLHNLMSRSNPGSRVSVTFDDTNNAKHTVSMTLATGPAD
jgi:S1-C subfamily serine protease